MANEPADATAYVVTDCCARLLPVEQTLVGDTHIPDLCPACLTLDGQPHDSHVTCNDGKCPGRDWSYIDGQIVESAPARSQDDA